MAGGNLRKGSDAGGGRAYHKWTTYCIIVVGSEVRVIPVEAVLAFRAESVGKVTSWWDRVLFMKDRSGDGSLNDTSATLRVKSHLGDPRYTIHLWCPTLKEAYEKVVSSDMGNKFSKSSQ